MLDWLPAAAATDEGFPARLSAHFGESPAAFPATRLDIPEYDRPNVQVALDAYLARPERSAELLGFSAPSHTEFSLSQLVARGQAARGLTVGPVGRTIVELDQGRSLTCLTLGLLLVRDGDDRLAVLIAHERYPFQTPFLQVMARTAETAERFVAELRRLMTEHNVYRGKVISLSPVGGAMGTKGEVTFHRRRRISRDRIILPDGVLESVERGTLQFDRHSDALRSQGRHLRRGLLLHGPPGTGKTLTATYLADASTSWRRSAARWAGAGWRCCSSCSTRSTAWARTPTSCS